MPQLKRIATDTIKCSYARMDPERRHHSFEIFGYDFMVDEDLNVWLLEVNTNPCLELSSPYLARLIPQMIDNSLKVAVDPLFPPPPFPNSKKHTIPDPLDNKFELVFDEGVDAEKLPAELQRDGPGGTQKGAMKMLIDIIEEENNEEDLCGDFNCEY